MLFLAFFNNIHFLLTVLVGDKSTQEWAIIYNSFLLL